MKKILIDKTLYAGMNKTDSLLQRADVSVFIAESNDEILSLHKKEKMSLIIARLDAAGSSAERLYAQIRNDAELRAVSLIMVCEDNAVDKLRAERCGANTIVTKPVAEGILLDKARAFLNISTRGSYRVLLNVKIDASKDQPFFCRSENISVTGLLLETDRTLAAGDRLSCSFFLPGAKQIEVSGEVVRAIDSGKQGSTHYGVKFTKISSLDAAAINEFIKKKAAKN